MFDLTLGGQDAVDFIRSAGVSRAYERAYSVLLLPACG